MSYKQWQALIKQMLKRYYSQLKPHVQHSDLKHEINLQQHNQHYVIQLQTSPNTQLENLTSKYQIE